MNFSRGSLPRLLAAALLAPPVSIVIPVVVGLLLSIGRETWSDPGESWVEPFVLWMLISLGVAVAAWVLRRLGKTRLRHHLLLAVAIGAVPIVWILLEFVSLISMDPGEVAIEMPYPCIELFRHETLNLVGAVTTALTLGVIGAVFKWLAYGLDHKTTSMGWKIAGGVFVLALVTDMLAPVAMVTGAFPSWYSLSKFCA